MKEYICVQLNHHNKISQTIDEHQKQGWHLHTYQATGFGTAIMHYLLFERA